MPSGTCPGNPAFWLQLNNWLTFSILKHNKVCWSNDLNARREMCSSCRLIQSLGRVNLSTIVPPTWLKRRSLKVRRQLNSKRPFWRKIYQDTTFLRLKFNFWSCLCLIRCAPTFVIANWQSVMNYSGLEMVSEIPPIPSTRVPQLFDRRSRKPSQLKFSCCFRC